MGKALGFLAKAQVTIETVLNDKNLVKTFSPQ